ncbi:MULTISPECIES: helix-turn-helix domain-containing protein [unclassified Clostridium]|uniref:helix-turn-helix domain-containing protein n=1 Tax=unclassified Clostridium TaxID=2614128 RepID=UPI0020799524|nr:MULTISPECIES: helix-turn-helix domain-containing protein [unclassified Clostridium]
MAYFRLETYLNFYNLTQKDLSDGTGINRNTINRYCKNTFEKITKEHLDLLTSYFQCSIGDILATDNDSVVKYPSNLIMKTILDNKVPYNYVCVNGYDISTNEDKIIEFIEPDKPNRRIITGDDALQNARLFEQEYGYNPIMTDEEIYNREMYDMEQQQIRLDMEYDFELTLESIINSIISKTDIDSLPKKIQAEIKAYKEVGDISIAFKFTVVYRAIYWIMAKQLYNQKLLQFMSKVRRIYTNNTNLSVLSDKELTTLTNEANTILGSLNKKTR